MSGTPLEGRLRRCLPAIKPDRLRTAKAVVEKAVKMKKVFSVQGPYPVIRTALWARGWVERRLPGPVQKTLPCHSDEEEEDDDGVVNADVTERVDEGEKDENLNDMYDLMSRLVRNETSYFYWTTRRDSIDCRSLQNDQMTNHFANAGTFTTKVGLCMNLRNLQWFDTADPDTFFPRCYRLGAEDEKQAFIEDFRRTACTSLLQHVVETWKNDEAKELNDVKRHIVGPEIIDTALLACQEFLSVLKHSDIDTTVETTPSVEEQQWATFLQNYYMVVHKCAVISGSGEFVELCKAMLARLQEVCPQLHIDGLNNIWIVKPGAKSRGRGIMCMNRLDEILALVDTDRALMKESKWVVQKYLERPLLVHGTKFDLRQWFLVTDWNPLTVWFYKECYLRFSTQPYSTKNLHSSVHLCNNSIQKHFQPSHDRHPGVPEDNMWSCSQFRSFLQQQGRGEDWESVVVPGMQQAVVHALQTAQDLVEPRKASFELFGADFMLGADLRPWLLEINASPTMECSTAVTTRLCPAVQVDTLRVVLDRRTDPNAYTGGFQLIYKQATVEVPHYVGVHLLVEGNPIRQPRPVLHRQTNTALTIHLPSDQSSPDKAEIRYKASGQRPHLVADLCCSGKESQERKRLLTSISPKRECEMRAEVQNVLCVRRTCNSFESEQPLMIRSEPQRKARRFDLSLRVNGAPLVPRSLSFSLGPSHRTSEDKIVHGSKISRSFLPPTTFEPRHRISNQICPPFQGPLPSLEICRLPHVAVTTFHHNSAFSSYPGIHKQELFIRSQRQNPGRGKGESTGEHKH
ncbi:tubulin monoglycylase TTLL3 isoform X2 [Melanotaenia boesemani]|uniref:tubulin monoglycylase TTLL3 isoform X2 n=1 Tax=Melanotaenia boesemani TaxID=1250792 RepID=UPI001C059885|nr:tubulin monoglycylase TTLL3 isoform X2 [Melanotaenia boesemani]